MALEDLLSLEDEFYREGYEEGLRENTKHNYTEGKQYGLQVGFQRYLLLGQIEGLLDVIETWNIDAHIFSKNIETIRMLLAGLKMDNDDANVAQYEASFIKIKNKLRTILLLLQKQLKQSSKDTMTFEAVENISMTIAGELKGYIKEEETNDGLIVQDQAQDW